MKNTRYYPMINGKDTEEMSKHELIKELAKQFNLTLTEELDVFANEVFRFGWLRGEEYGYNDK